MQTKIDYQLQQFIQSEKSGDGRLERGEAILQWQNGSLYLSLKSHPQFKPWKPEFSTYYAGKGRDPLLRAIGSAGVSIIDATAGWCQDAVHLAKSGNQVLAVESNAVVYTMVQCALSGISDSKLQSSLELKFGNSLQIIPQQVASADVIYLDPMYPDKRKSSATRKELVLLRELTTFESSNPQALLRCALKHARKRVVVKRPHYADPIGPGKIGETRSKLVRYDIYAPIKP